MTTPSKMIQNVFLTAIHSIQAIALLHITHTLQQATLTGFQLTLAACKGSKFAIIDMLSSSPQGCEKLKIGPAMRMMTCRRM